VASRDVVIEARRLSKSVGRRRLVDDVTFSVRRGNVYGLVGADGAGKSAVARMIVGLAVPTTGEAGLLGRTMGPGAHRVFERVGFLPDEAACWMGLSVRRNVESWLRLVGVRDATAARRALDRVGLSHVAERRASLLDDDERRLLGLARAIAHSPEVLVLDEPTRGLGRAQRRLVLDLLAELVVQRGVTVLVCAHVAEGVTDLAEHVGILAEGRLVEELDREALRERGRAHVEVVVGDPGRAAMVLEERLQCRDYAVCQDDLIRVYVDGDRAGEVNAALQAEGVTVSRLAVNEGSLEDLLERLASGKAGS